jgi:hypothetical protein
VGIILLILAACNATSPIEPAAAPESESRTNGDEPVIIYERQGGLKGIGPSEYVWRIYEDGRITNSQDQSWQVTPAEVDALLTSINFSNFRSLDANYVPKDTCCDRAQHTITIQTDGQSHKVTTLDGADMPENLTSTLDAINTFLMALQ